MASIEKIIEINATPEDVFEVICRIDDFPKYTNLIKDVKEIEAGKFRWVAKFGSLEFKWDSIITELIEGKRVAWASISGIKNSGSFNLEPTEKGTKLTFLMEYHFHGGVVEDLVDYMSSYWLEKISSDIINRVKKNLEG
ncbi:MAG: SRPBCC family protein [Thermodesulfobacteriota bacterium]